MRAWRGLLLALAAAAPAHATPVITFDAAASNAYPTLSIPVGVRATGMGDVYTAVGDDVYALRWNPAGLARLRGYQLGVMDNEWSSALGLRQDYFAYGQATDSGAAWAVGLDLFNLGSLEQRDASGALLGKADASATGLNLGYARPMPGQPAWKLGLSLEALQQSLYGASTVGYGASVGLLWDHADWSLGASLGHLGVSGAGGNTPGVLQLGASSTWLTRTLLLAVDAELPQAGTPRLKAGGELAYGDLRVRAGWRQALGDSDLLLTGLTAGVGFKVGSITLDYSFVPYGQLSTVHRVQATVDLPRDFFSPRQALVEGTTTSAKVYFDAASLLEKQGETLKALVQYQRCVEAYPSALWAAALPFFAQAGKKVDELQAQLNKGGDHSQIQKLSRDAISQADRELKAEHYKVAIEALTQAKKLDPGNADLDAKLAEVRQALESHLAAFREAARFADKENNLAMAVESYRKVLAVDESDAEALAYLNAKRQTLKFLLQSMDRKAIFYYVGGKLEDAIKAWNEGEALDYFNDVDFKRNVDKARKQLELKKQ